MDWIYFSEKEKALMTGLQNENLISEEFARAHSIAVVNARANHLQVFYVNNTIDVPPQFTPQNRDQELNNTYAKCFLQMNTNTQGLLQSAERAWITYRDADIAAAASTSANPKWTDAAIVCLTLARTDELISIVQSLRQDPITTTPAQVLPPPVTILGSPNPDDVKAVSEFQDEEKAVLNALLAKKDDSFFKNADVIKNVPELPVEISNQISELDSKYLNLSKRPYSAQLLKPAANEGAVVELLSSWSEFTQRLKAGNVVDADLAIQRAVSLKPKDIAPDYLPLWQTIGSWHDLFVTDEAQYYDHMDKGNSFAELGKTSAAIKEYKAAYDIFASPTAAAKIKKLREQSLGL